MILLEHDSAVSLYEHFRLHELLEVATMQCSSECKELILVNTMLSDFGAATVQQFGELLDSKESDMQGCFALLGDLTAVQAGFRELQAGETISKLVKRCKKGTAKRKFMNLSDRVLERLDKFED